MSDKKPTSPIMGWFEAGLGLFTEQLNAANQQVQHRWMSRKKHWMSSPHGALK